jgi:4-oxalocrotonate tautomerase
MELPTNPHSSLKLQKRSFPKLYPRSGEWFAERKTKETVMPMVDIQLISGVFTPEQKKEMIRKVTDTMVDIEGEAMRGVTWVRVQEYASGEWGIGGKAMTADDVKALGS